MLKHGLTLTILTIVSTAHAASMCNANQLLLSVDHGQGRFDGMSQSGMLLKVANEGDSACALSTRPVLDFQDKDYRSLRLSGLVAPGMRPGPRMRPLILPAHTSAVSEVRWVSGEVYDSSVCVTPAHVALRIGMGVVLSSFEGRLCGPHDHEATYQATFFVPSS